MDFCKNGRDALSGIEREINESAHLIKFGALGSWAIEDEKNNLGRLLLMYKMKNVYNKSAVDTTFDAWEVTAYDVFTMAYEYAFEDFMTSGGDVDTIGDFAGLFERYYNGGRRFKTISLPDGRLVDRKNVEFKIRSANAKKHLRDAANSKCVRYILPKGIVTPGKFISEMMELGCSENQARQMAEEIFSGSHEASLDVCAEMVHMDGCVDEALCPLLDSYDKLIASDATGRVKEFARYLITLLVYEYGIEMDHGIRSIVDAKYFIELMSNPDRTGQEVLSSILGIRPETVRKNFKLAKDLLKEAA